MTNIDEDIKKEAEEIATVNAYIRFLEKKGYRVTKEKKAIFNFG